MSVEKVGNYKEFYCDCCQSQIVIKVDLDLKKYIQVQDKLFCNDICKNRMSDSHYMNKNKRTFEKLKIQRENRCRRLGLGEKEFKKKNNPLSKTFADPNDIKGIRRLSPKERKKGKRKNVKVTQFYCGICNKEHFFLPFSKKCSGDDCDGRLIARRIK